MSPSTRTRSRPSATDARVTLIEFDEEEPAPKRVKSSPTKTPKPLKLELEAHEAHPAPKRWRETWDILSEQRKGIVAPVDTMGCTEAGKLENDAERPDTDPRSRRFQTLISLMLSSQTKDPVTAEATANLRRNLPGGLTLESVLAADEEAIAQSINKVGFWRRKTDYIKRTAVMLRDDYEGEVPRTIEGLLALPGVGPKMGFLALQEAWGLNVGIGVDTHVHRLTNRLRWHRKTTETAEHTRLNLQSWLPKELHSEINKLLVGFGQTICLPIGPRCDLCNVAEVPGLCPSKQAVSPRKSKTPKVEPIVKVEVEAAIIDGVKVEGDVLVDADGEAIEVREVKGKQEVLKHEDAW